jgi:hypothetical protein
MTAQRGAARGIGWRRHRGKGKQGAQDSQNLIWPYIILIQHFKIGDIVSLKVPREDRTSTDNRRPFECILEEPHPYSYKVLT